MARALPSSKDPDHPPLDSTNTTPLLASTLYEKVSYHELALTFAFRGHDEFEQLHGYLRLHRGSLYNIIRRSVVEWWSGGKI